MHPSFHLIVKRLGLGLGTWDLGPGNRIENRESRIENRETRIENRIETTPCPSADSKISWATPWSRGSRDITTAVIINEQTGAQSRASVLLSE